MDMRKVIDVYAAATACGPGPIMTLFLRSELPKALYEWKTENKQTNPVTSLSCAIMLITRVSSLSTMSAPLRMTAKKLGQTNVRAV